MPRAVGNFHEVYPPRWLLAVNEYRDAINNFLITGSHTTCAGIHCVTENNCDSVLLNSKREANVTQFINTVLYPDAWDLTSYSLKSVGYLSDGQHKQIREMWDNAYNKSEAVEIAEMKNKSFGAQAVQKIKTVFHERKGVEDSPLGGAMFNMATRMWNSTTNKSNITYSGVAGVAAGSLAAVLASPVAGLAVGAVGAAAVFATASGREQDPGDTNMFQDLTSFAKEFQRIFVNKALGTFRDLIRYPHLFTQRSLNLLINPNRYGDATAQATIMALGLRTFPTGTAVEAYRDMRLLVKKSTNEMYGAISILKNIFGVYVKVANNITDEARSSNQARTLFSNSECDVCTDLSAASTFIWHDVIAKWSMCGDMSGLSTSTIHGISNGGTWFEVGIEDGTVKQYAVANEDQVKVCRADATYDMYSIQSLPRYAREKQIVVWNRITDKYNQHISKAPFQKNGVNNKIFRKDILYVNEFGKYSLDTSDLTVIFEDHVSQRSKRMSDLQITNLMQCRGTENGLFKRVLELAYSNWSSTGLVAKLIVINTECNQLGIPTKFLKINPFQKWDGASNMRTFQSMPPPRVHDINPQGNSTNTYNKMYVGGGANTLMMLKTLGSYPEYSSFAEEYLQRAPDTDRPIPSPRDFDGQMQILYRKVKISSMNSSRVFDDAEKRKYKAHWIIYKKLCEVCGGPPVMRPAPFELLVDFSVASELRHGKPQCDGNVSGPIRTSRQYDFAKQRAVPDFTGRSGHYIPEPSASTAPDNLDLNTRNRALVQTGQQTRS